MKKTLLRNLIIAILVIIIIFSTMTRTYAIGVINSVELAGVLDVSMGVLGYASTQRTISKRKTIFKQAAYSGKLL